MQTRRGFLGLLAGSAVAAALSEGKPNELDSNAIDFNKNFAAAQEKRSTLRRLAYLRISNKMLDSLIPEGMTLALPEYIGDKDFSWLEKALLLPPRVKIVDVSRHVFFLTDETAIKIEGPMFEEHLEGFALRLMSPWYETRNGKPTFIGWNL